MHTRDNPHADNDVYAALLQHTVKIAMVLLGASYCVYLFWGESLRLQPKDIAAAWAAPAAQFALLAGNGIEASILEFLPHLCIQMMASVSLLCVLAMLTVYFLQKKRLYFLICLVQTCIILFAMTGLANSLL